jgi:hypothetical protein
MSMTTDEGIHTASAYLALTRGEHRFDTEHPFLFKYLTALPLLVLQPNPPPNDQVLWTRAKPLLYDSWRESREWTDEWFYRSGNNAQLMIFLARIPGVLVLLGLCWMVYHLGRKWFSPTIGLWALFFTAFNPTLLAHGALTNTDIPLAAAFLLALWALWAWGEKPGLRAALWVGLALGVCVLTKYSGLGILPIAGIWLIYVGFRSKIKFTSLAAQAGVVVVTIWASIWVVYLFKSPLNWDTQVFDSAIYPSSYLSDHGKEFLPKLEVMRWILPSNYLKGVFLTIGQSLRGRDTFLLNHFYPSGKWFYFPVLFLLKTQVIALALFFSGLWTYRRQWKPRSWSPLTVLMIITIAIFGLLSIKSKLNLGIRHIAPLMVLMAFLLAITTEKWGRLSRRTYLYGCVIVLFALPVIWQFQTLLGFANVFVYPRDHAYLFFDDSNLDWGQQAQEIGELGATTLHHAPIYTPYRWNPYALSYFGANTRRFVPGWPFPRDGYFLITAFQLARDLHYRQLRDIKPAYIVQNNTFVYRSADLPH